jgi:hypothetical protein
MLVPPAAQYRFLLPGFGFATVAPSESHEQHRHASTVDRAERSGGRLRGRHQHRAALCDVTWVMLPDDAPPFPVYYDSEKLWPPGASSGSWHCVARRRGADSRVAT